MSPPKASSNSLCLTVKGRAKGETEVVSYVEDMLSEVGLTSGEFALTIVTKVQSGGEHHQGVVLRDIKRNALHLYVQYGDNGTRFECYLTSSEFKPKSFDLFLRRNKVIIDGHYVRKAKPTPTPLTESQQIMLDDLRAKTVRLKEARARSESISMALDALSKREVALKAERDTLSSILSDPELIAAEKSLTEFTQLLKS